MIIVVILIIFLIFIFSKKKEDKGAIGENKVNRILDNLPEQQYISIKDLLLKTEKGTTQIDHVVISYKGIFVIETKNYDGLIFGSDKQKYWTQVLYKNKYKFYNPVWQNKGHISAIKRVLNRYDIPMYSIVAFSNRCKLEKIDSETPVIYMSDLTNYLLNIDDGGYIGLDERMSIRDKLISLNIKGKEAREEHIRQVNMKKD